MKAPMALTAEHIVPGLQHDVGTEEPQRDCPGILRKGRPEGWRGYADRDGKVVFAHYRRMQRRAAVAVAVDLKKLAALAKLK